MYVDRRCWRTTCSIHSIELSQSGQECFLKIIGTCTDWYLTNLLHLKTKYLNCCICDQYQSDMFAQYAKISLTTSFKNR